MPGKTSLRRANDSDWRAFYGREPYEGWVGFCAERDGTIIAFGYVWIDQTGRAWVGTDHGSRVPPLMLHHAIADFFAAMQHEGIPALYALCDERIPTATRWLTWLGFAIDETLAKVYMPEIDKPLPVWKRLLSGVAS